jgi:ABC-2 type transport system permease protein
MRTSRSWGRPVSELSAALTLAHRDVIKLLRDRARIVSDFAFPLIFIGVLGTSLQAGFGGATSFNLLHFVFTGVLAQTIWQSTAMGVIFLLIDREQDFSQEIFVSPISRYTIVFGKILGESLVAFPQFLAILVFGIVIGVPFTLEKLVALIPAALIVALYGGAFGLLVLSRMDNQRQANQIFPFVMLPQFFLAGIFNPIENLPWFLDILTKIVPMRYAVDLIRDVYYAGGPDVPLLDLPTNLAIIGAQFLLFMVIGTAGFVRGERNR